MNVSFNVLHFVLMSHEPILLLWLTNSLNSYSNHTSLIVAIQGFPALQRGPSISNKVVGKKGPN